MMSLLNDVLDMGRIEIESLPIANRPFLIRTILNDACHVVSEAMPSLALTSNISPDLPDMVYGDPLRFQQILQNLLLNAYKLSQPGANIWIEARVLTRWKDACTHPTELASGVWPGEAHGDEHEGVPSRLDSFTQEPLLQRRQSAASSSISPEAGRNSLWAMTQIRVKDTGMGMTQEMLARLFVPYTQEGTARLAKEYSGSGLGLAITRHIVGKMGGRIYAESTLGKGSLFTVEIPFRVATDHELPSSQSSANVSLTAAASSVVNPASPCKQPLTSASATVRLSAASHKADAMFQGQARAASPNLIPMHTPTAERDPTQNTKVSTRDHPQDYFSMKPLKASHPVTPTSNTPSARSSKLQELRMLVVDDSAINRRILVKNLQMCYQGFSGSIAIEQAEDGLQAIQVCGEQAFDIIWMGKTAFIVA